MHNLQLLGISNYKILSSNALMFWSFCHTLIYDCPCWSSSVGVWSCLHWPETPGLLSRWSVVQVQSHARNPPPRSLESQPSRQPKYVSTYVCTCSSLLWFCPASLSYYMQCVVYQIWQFLIIHSLSCVCSLRLSSVVLFSGTSLEAWLGNMHILTYVCWQCSYSHFYHSSQRACPSQPSLVCKSDINFMP